MLDLDVDGGARASPRTRSRRSPRPRAGARGRGGDPVRRAADRHRPAPEMAPRRKLKEVHARFRHTLVYVTHDQNEALTFADKVIVMHDGEVVQLGTPQDLFERPVHRRRLLHRLAGHELPRCRFDGERLIDGTDAVLGDPGPLPRAKPRRRAGSASARVRGRHPRADGTTLAQARSRIGNAGHRAARPAHGQGEAKENAEVPSEARTSASRRRAPCSTPTGA